jgi:hypothetical protein
MPADLSKSRKAEDFAHFTRYPGSDGLEVTTRGLKHSLRPLANGSDAVDKSITLIDSVAGLIVSPIAKQIVSCILPGPVFLAYLRLKRGAGILCS